MAIEKKWAAVAAQSLLSDGTAEGVVSIPLAYLFRVGQTVILNSSTQPGIELKVKRITDANTMHLGGKGQNIDHREDISAYLVADAANVLAKEAPRSNISPDDVWRAVYSEEPSVAIRSVLVDELGDYYTLSNPLPVDAVINLDNIDFPTAETPTIQNVAMAAANTEYSAAIPVGTKGFRARIRRDGNNPPGRLQVTYTASQSNTTYITVMPGEWHSPPADLQTVLGLTIYFRSNKANQVLEIESWT